MDAFSASQVRHPTSAAGGDSTEGARCGSNRDSPGSPNNTVESGLRSAVASRRVDPGGAGRGYPAGINPAARSKQLQKALNRAPSEKATVLSASGQGRLFGYHIAVAPASFPVAVAGSADDRPSGLLLPH